MNQSSEPIAIVGMACRLPGGVTNPDAFWTLLSTKTDAISQIPNSRWSKDFFFHPNAESGGAQGLSFVWSAGVIDGIELFDAAFFGMSPREAEQVDPQQRLMLELAWEALEDAGIPPSRLGGTACGVFVGISFNDFAQMRCGDSSTINPYYMSGGALAIAANRVSYALDLHGPSLSVDTACSSSLVALHLACQSLRTGEIPFALVGGVNALLSPFPFIGFSNASMLSPDGRCRAFDAKANGYVRSEGGVVLAMKPLSGAIRDGDPIHAVILGTGVNSDGRTQGISLPSDKAQEALLARVYDQAGVPPGQVRYVEAHGTGTAVGDPLELSAIGRFFAPHRLPGDPLLIGSVKTNIGHLESGAGMAGLLKVVLSVKHREIPANLHFSTPSPQIPFEQLGLSVVSESTALNGSDPVYVGVNSFGFGGTNAHAVLSSFAPPPRSPRKDASCIVPPLYLSARSGSSLQNLAAKVAAFVESDDPKNYYDLAYSAAFHRDLHPQRLVVRGIDVGEITHRLWSFARGEEVSGLESGASPGKKGRMALVFSGNGSQWQGMGCELLCHYPVFFQAVSRFDEVFEALSGWSVIDEFRRPVESSRLQFTEFAQPCLLAFQIGLLEVLRSFGVLPEAVLGHSVGEIAAAYASGALSMSQVAHLVHARSKAQELTRGLGRMAAVGMSARKVQDAINGFGGGLEIACVNSPVSVTVSGSGAALADLGRRLEPSGVFFRILDLDYAFHSRVLDSVRDDLLKWIGPLEPSPMRVPLISTVTGGRISPTSLDTGYWWDNLRKPVLFDTALSGLIDDGFNLFVEVGPHPILLAYVRESLKEKSAQGRTVALTKRQSREVDQLESAKAQLHIFADSIDRRIDFPVEGRYRPLPLYAWQRERHWYVPSRESLNVIHRFQDHPLLGSRAGGDSFVWENRIDLDLCPFLADHRLGDNPVYPASAYVEMVLAACALQTGAIHQEIENLEIQRPMVFEPSHTRVVRFCLSPDDGRFVIESRERLSDQPWVVHAIGRVSASTPDKQQKVVEIPDMGDRRVVSSKEHYAAATALGLNYGPAFQAVRSIWIDGREAWGELEMPQGSAAGAGDYLFHPVILDGGLQVFIDLACAHLPGSHAAHVPVEFSRIVRRAAGQPAFCRARLERVLTRSLVVSFCLLDRSGRVLLELTKCRLRRAEFPSSKNDLISLLEFVTRPAQRYDPVYVVEIPDLGEIEGVVQSAMNREGTRFRLHDFHRSGSPLVDAAISGFCHEALTSLCSWECPLSVEELIRTAGLDMRQRIYLTALLGELETDGLARRVEERWTLSKATDLPSPVDVWRRLVADHPAHLVQWLLLGRTGKHLKAILRGQSDAGTLVSREPIHEVFEHFVARSLLSNALVEGLLEIVRQWPRHRKLKVLEVGATSIHRASMVESRIGNTCLEYTLSSGDPKLVPALKMAAGSLKNVTVASFDPEAPLEGQGLGLAPLSFDVVFSCDVLHRLRNVTGAMSVIRALLAPGGILLVGEQGPDRWHDFVFGIDPDWWMRDRSRPVSCRLPHESLVAALRESGFEALHVLPETRPSDGSGALLVLARKPMATTVEDSKPCRRRWLILQDRNGASLELGRCLKDRFEGKGDTVFVAQPGSDYRRMGDRTFSIRPTVAEDFVRLVKEIGPEPRLESVVHLMGLELSYEPRSEELLELQERRIVTSVHLVQALEEVGASVFPRFVLVTGRALPLSDSVNGRGGVNVLPSQACLVGLGRVLANEYPSLRVSTVDVRGDDPVRLGERLQIELEKPDPEDEILLGESTRHVRRLVSLGEPSGMCGCRAQPKSSSSGENRAEPAVEPSMSSSIPASLPASNGGASKSPVQPCSPSPDNVRLGCSTPGPFTHLVWSRVPRPWPAPGQVEIEVRAAGLNFRDVMWAMGLLPDEVLEDGLAGPTLGLECAGVVTRVGDGVKEIAVGDEVVGFGPSCFSRYVTTSAFAVVKKPSSTSFEEAATIPGAFFTAYYSLKHLANLRPGERVLIHGGAGGVGLAAIQYAGLVGAEIFSTAGSDEKRDFLQLMGVDHVFDSRSHAFADRILEATHGEGVDVIVNSLAGEAIHRNLGILKPFGRFIELGKRDFCANTRIGLKPFRQNVSYFAVDVDQVMAKQSNVGRALLLELMALFEQEKLRPLVHVIYPRSLAVDGFRHMQQSKHIGKIVVTFDSLEGEVRCPELETFTRSVRIDPAGSYLVVGGLSGLGLKTSEWLAKKGASTLLLLGRGGIRTEASKKAISNIEARGTKVHVFRVDVTDRKELASVLAGCGSIYPPLKGVVHSAMVLDDGVIRNLTRDRILKVLAPKILGARHLDELTREHSLDFFVMYSSVTTLFGNPGQASYVAANSFLEALAHERRREGRPALTVAWGTLSDVGTVAENPELKRHLRDRIGDPGLTADESLNVLDQLLATDRVSVAATRLNWRKLAGFLPSVRAQRFCEVLGDLSCEGTVSRLDEPLAERYLHLSTEERRTALVDLVKRTLGQIMQWPPERIDVDRPTAEMGLDSLMAVELHVALEKELGMSLPRTAISPWSSIVDLAGSIARRLESPAGGGGSERDTEADEVKAMLEKHGISLEQHEIEEVSKTVRDVRIT